MFKHASKEKIKSNFVIMKISNYRDLLLWLGNSATANRPRLWQWHSRHWFSLWPWQRTIRHCKSMPCPWTLTPAAHAPWQHRRHPLPIVTISWPSPTPPPTILVTSHSYREIGGELGTRPFQCRLWPLHINLLSNVI